MKRWGKGEVYPFLPDKNTKKRATANALRAQEKVSCLTFLIRLELLRNKKNFFLVLTFLRINCARSYIFIQVIIRAEKSFSLPLAFLHFFFSGMFLFCCRSMLPVLSTVSLFFVFTLDSIILCVRWMVLLQAKRKR